VRIIKDYLIKNYNNKTYDEMSKEMGVSHNIISKHIKILIRDGEIERKYKKWTVAEDNYVINVYDTTPKKELAEILGVKTQTLRDRYYKLKNGKVGKTKKRLEQIIIKERKKAKADAEYINKKYAAAIAQDFIKPGLKLDELKLNIGQAYKIKMTDRNRVAIFEGKLIQDTINHVTLQNKKGIRESFLKVDLLLKNEYEVI